MFRAAALLLLAVSTLTAQTQPPRDRLPAKHGSGTIIGRVVGDATGDPIRKARVIAQADVGRIPPVFTDIEGRFVITGLPAARYTLSCAKPGYAATMFGRAETGGSPARIEVADGATVRDIEVRMPKAAAIMGRVVDGWGEPVARAFVNAEIAGSRRPGVAPIVAAIAETDDLGEYRLGGLRAGSYLVSARAIPGSVLQAEMPTEVRTNGEFGVHAVFFAADGATIMSDGGQGTPRVFYPASASADRAQAIALASGAEQPAIDFTVARPQPQVTRTFNPPLRAADGRVIKPTAVVSGRIVDRESRPLARARVRLIPSAGSSGPRFAVTGDDGAYEFREVAAGAYRLAAGRTGYTSLEYGQRYPLEPGERVWVEQGATVAHVDISLPRHAAISGRILDENGDPIEGAVVRLLQTRYVSGRRRLAAPSDTSPARTNDLGRFRLSGVPPGTYLVSAEIGQVTTTDLPGYTRTYFPGTVNPADAQRVTVGPAEQIGEIEFGLLQTRTATVGGVVTDSGGNPWSGAVVMNPSDRSGAAFSLSMGAIVDSDGVFAFPNVAPGEYVIRAFRSRLNPWTEAEFASQFVTVAEADVSLMIRASAGATIAGRVVLEGAGEPKRSTIEIAAVPVDPDLSPAGTGAFARAEIHDDWTFELGSITGPRRFRVVRAPAGWGLRAVLLRGRDVTDTLIPFAAGDDFSGIEVVLTDRITRLNATVSDARGRAIADCAAIVFAADRDRWYLESRFLRLVRPSADGVIDVQGMPPGDYFVAAIDRGPTAPDADDWQDPAALGALTTRASRVLLTEGLTATASLKVIRR